MLGEGGQLVVRAFTLNQPYLLGDRVSREEASISWQAYDTGQPVLIDNYAAWSRRRDFYDQSEFEIRWPTFP